MARVDRADEGVGAGGQRRRPGSRARPAPGSPCRHDLRAVASRMSTSCGVARVLVLEVDRERRVGGAVELGLVEGDVLRGERRTTGGRRRPLGPGRRGRVRPRRPCRRSQASKSAGRARWTSNSMIRWPVPHSSAHWPRKVWPASSASIVRSNWLTLARHDVALEQELRDVEGVDDVGAGQVEVDRLAGRQDHGRRRSPVGAGLRRRPDRLGRRPSAR